MKFTAADAETVHRLLTWRRDVRHFSATPLDEAVVARLHAAMELSPSVGNARPWRVLRIASADLRAAVRAEFSRCNGEAAQLYPGQTRTEYLRLKLAGMDTAPLQLAVFTVPDPAEGRGLGRRTIPATLEQSTAMAIHTLWLAARAENIGLGLVSILDPAALERICGVPPEWRFSAYLCLGVAETDDALPLLHRAGWQENTACAWQAI